jgi:phosphinothricin acetyltransferase
MDFPTGSVLIRPAIADDLPAIVAIYNSTIPGYVTADTQPVTVESRWDWFQGYSVDRRPLWVLEIEGTVAGWLGLRSFYGRPAYDITVELSLYVAKDFRRQGIGRSLLAYAIAAAPALGLTTLLGLVFAKNTPSLQLLKAFGFEQWGYLPQVARLATEDADLVILGKKVIGTHTRATAEISPDRAPTI